MTDILGRLNRIEVPLDVGNWALKEENADMLAGEYNLLVQYLNDREKTLGLSGVSGARHGGFILASIITSMAMDVVDNAPKKISATIITTAQALSELAHPTSIKEINETSPGRNQGS